MSAPDFIELISGHRNRWRDRLARGALRALEPLYRIAINRRNAALDRRPEKSIAVSVPVISIGNLTTGGTGKTPMVRWVVEALTATGERPAIVSRGYGSVDGKPNDEARELALYLPDIPHLQDKDRVAAARMAIEKHGATRIVLDDGFQHRRLRRDLDIVLIDATAPFGHGHLLPRGLLREPLQSLSRADLVVVTRVDQVEGIELEKIIARVATFVPTERILRVRMAADHLRDVHGKRTGLDALAGRSVVGFCGIGNPAAFLRTLADLSYNVVEFVTWPDHWAFSVADGQRLDAIASRTGAEALICTVKDLVKIRELPLATTPARAVVIAVQFVEGEEVFRSSVAELA